MCFVLHRKETLNVCLNVTAEKMLAKWTSVKNVISEMINDYTCNYTEPMW